MDKVDECTNAGRRADSRRTTALHCGLTGPLGFTGRGASHRITGLILASALLTLVPDRALGAESAPSGGSGWRLRCVPDQPDRADGPRRLEDASRERIAALSNLLFDLDAAELDAAAATHRRTKPLEVVLAIVDRAGRPIPPGLSRARTAQRKLRADEARAWIARELESDSGRESVTLALDLALARQPADATAAPRGITAELTTAAMGVVATLDLAAHAPAVAGWLAPEAAASLRSAARTRLFEMYGRWFDSAAEFEAAWPRLVGRTPVESRRDELLAAHEVANERALALIEFAPDRVGHDLVDWRDPSMAARAARAIGRAVASDRLKPDAARAILVQGLAAERRPAVLHARLETLLDLIQGVDPTSVPAAQVRDVFAGLAGSLTEAPQAGGAGAAWTVMAGLPRLPHTPGAGGDDARVATLDLGVRLFGSVLDGTDVRMCDPDAVQGAISALVDLARSIEDEALRKTASRPLAELVRPFVLEADSAPLRVRRASAVAFGLSVEPEDAGDLVQLVSQMRTPELEYELLGALKAAIAVLEPGSDASEAVVDALFRAAADPDFDRRGRALELLLSDDVRPALEAVERATRARWLASSLVAEPTAELRVARIALLERIGDRDAFALLVGDAETGGGTGAGEGGLIAELADSGEAVTEALASAASSLAWGDRDLRMRIARQLVGPDPVDRMTDPLTVVRRRSGLRVALAGDDESARGLSLADHRWIVGVALEIRHAAPGLARELFIEPGSAERLEQHRQSLESYAEPEDGPATATLGVLLRADRLRPSTPNELATDAARSAEIEVVSRLFDDAAARLASLPSRHHGWTSADLRLEAVSFLRSIGRFDAALARMEQLFDEGLIDLASLPGSTLRAFVELIEAQSVPTEAQLERALALRLEGIRREDWSAEDAGLRLGDLESALLLAASTRSEDSRVRVANLLRTLLTSESGEPTKARSELEAYDAERIQALLRQLESTPGAAPDTKNSDDAKGDDGQSDDESRTGSGGIDPNTDGTREQSP